MQRTIAVLTGIAVGGCAQSSTMPLSADTVQIVARAAPICGAAGAEALAFKQAAAETINRGYDKFVIVNGQYTADNFVAGYTPVVARSNGTAFVNGYGNSAIVTGSSTTTVTGGTPIHMTKHSQGIIVKMFKENDPAASNALSAKQTLGPDWQKISQQKSMTCLQ